LSNNIDSCTTFYIVRHGETLWNQQGLLQGHLDSPLSGLGVRQAQALNSFFKTCQWDLIICSDLERAFCTAEIINGSGAKPVTSDNRLRERNLGIAQGLTLDGFEQKYPEEFSKFNNGGADYRIPEGESIRDRLNRSMECLNEKTLQYRGKSIVVVTHGGILDGVFRYVNGISLEKKRTFSLFNASVNTLQVCNNDWSIVTWGYIDHLRALGSLDDWYRGAI
jgi:2,3-bisphosphoglycerate-dependent phosphoglycerate mutase